FRVVRLEFERQQPATCRQSASQPDRAITSQGPNLQDGLCSMNPRQQLQQLALARRNANRRQPRRSARLNCRLSSGIRTLELLLHLTISLCPLVLAGVDASYSNMLPSFASNQFQQPHVFKCSLRLRVFAVIEQPRREDAKRAPHSPRVEERVGERGP